MTRQPRRRFRIALYALCAMLLAQWTLAVHACPVARMPAQPAAPAAAHAAMHSSMTGCADAMAAAEHCADADADADAASYVDATLCIKHCEDEGQASGSAPMAAIDAPAEIAFRVELPAPPGALTATAAPASGDATAPPLIILYCVSLS